MAQASTTALLVLVIGCLVLATIMASGGTSTTGGVVMQPPPATEGGRLSTTSTARGSGHWPPAAAAGGDDDRTVGRRVLSSEALGSGKQVPLWAERLMLVAQAAGAPPSLASMVGTKHVFVAKNATSGDGQFASINAALAAQEDQTGSEHSILTVFIREGVYNETLNITRKHVILIGEGAGKTVITGSKSRGHHNLSTPDTATMSVHGKGFMAQDLSIQNTAGPSGLQAVALMSRANFSLVYRCSIEGFQDTLDADAGDQIYLDTDIRGTVDFVFGYARACFIGCRLLVRSSGMGPGKPNVVTAQGRSNAADRSGFSFHNCSVTADEGADLTGGVKTFLGRPWKNHSHVIFMQSFLDSLVHFTGWSEWEGRGPIPQTVLYLEYDNYGPGADTARRINITAVRTVTDCREAARYTADPFVDANLWMPKDKDGRDIIPYARRDPCAPPPAP